MRSKEVGEWEAISKLKPQNKPIIDKNIGILQFNSVEHSQEGMNWPAQQQQKTWKKWMIESMVNHPFTASSQSEDFFMK